MGGTLTALRRAGTALAAAVFPHHCVGCGAEGRVTCGECLRGMLSPVRGIFVCPGCGDETPLGRRCGRRACAAAEGIDGLMAAAPYGHPALRELLRLFKYERVTEAGEALAAACAAFAGSRREALRAVAADAVIVPVPLHPFKEALRGFNQADCLATAVSAAVGAALRRDLLARRLRWRAQASLAGIASRRANAAGSVRTIGRLAPGTRVVIVDDVATTGATLDACAAALKAVGAGEVWGVTLLKG